MISNQVPVSEVQHRNNTKYNMYRYAIQINFMLDFPCVEEVERVDPEYCRVGPRYCRFGPRYLLWQWC